MNIAGLFAGIGGFELGLHRAGHVTELLCDVLPTSAAVLQARFPGVDYHSDITSLRSLPRSVDLLCAGFPCQDLSQAGRTAGLDGDRSSLIGEVFRLLTRRRVPNVLLENVPFMLQLNGGRAMRAIVDEFERRGYRWAYRVVDSWSFGLPQRRERVFLLASRELEPSEVLLAEDAPVKRFPTAIGERAHGFYWTEGLSGLGWAVDAVPTLKNGSTIGIPSPPAVLLPDGRIVKLSVEDGERLQGFAEGWTCPAESVAKPSARWGLVGSAISVPVAEWIGRRLKSPLRYDARRDHAFPQAGRAPKAARFDGRLRHAVGVSVDPVGSAPVPLLQFLDRTPQRELLSVKATSGFLSRAYRAKLRFEDGFLDAVENHLTAMGGALPTRPLRRSQLELLAA